jgi:hypothetical protein
VPQSTLGVKRTTGSARSGANGVNKLADCAVRAGCAFFHHMAHFSVAAKSPMPLGTRICWREAAIAARGTVESGITLLINGAGLEATCGARWQVCHVSV